MYQTYQIDKHLVLAAALQGVSKKTLVFEIQISHIALNSSDMYNYFKSLSEL